MALTAGIVMGSEFCVAAGSFAMNDILDVERDQSVQWKPLVKGSVSLAQARRTTIGLLAIGLGSAFLLGVLPFVVAVMQVTVVYFYSSIKRRSGVIANVLTAATCASAFLYGAAVEANIGLAWIPTLVSTQMLISREVAKDVLDRRQDRAAGLPTLPLRHGMGVVMAVVAVSVTSAVVVSMLPQIRLAFHVGYITLFSIVNMMLLAALWIFLRSPDERGAKQFMDLTAGAFPIALIAFLL